jgi:hypothetical protein
MRRAALNLLLAVLSTAACLAAAEVVFYFVNRQAEQGEELPGPQAELARFFRYHPVLGHDGLPGVRGTFRRKPVTHNSRGGRGREVDFAKPPGVARVVVLGDSQAWGYGVGDDETIAAQLETLLAADARGRRTEVVNLGVSGYGTDQAFLKFLIDGLRYAPDEAVFVVFKNDLVENATTRYWGIEKPRLFLRGGELCLGNVPPRKAPGWPEDRLVAEGPHLVRVPLLGAIDLDRSQTFRFFARRQWRSSLLAPAQADLAAVRLHLPCLENRETYPGEGEEILVRAFRELATICRSRRVGLTVLFVPRPREVETPEAPTYYRGIQAVFDREGIPAVDLRERARDRGLTAAALFGPGDAHLSAAGSRFAAELIRDGLAR